MSTYANSEDPDRMQHNAAFHQGYAVKIIKICRKKNTIIFFENYNLTCLDLYMDYPKFIVSNQKEESVSIQNPVVMSTS